MTPQELRQTCHSINQFINDTVNSDTDDTSPITDGIIDIERYCSAKYRILWILKEPIDEIDEDGRPYGGGWNLMEPISKKLTIHDFKSGVNTYLPMIYISYGILNNFCLYNDMKSVYEDSSILDSFKSTGYINVKKLPGIRSSDNHVIASAYRQHKAILNRQIAEYNPEIIIGGYTLQHFFQDLEIIPSNMQKMGSSDFVIHDGKLFIHAYHPAQWKIAKEQYCNDIIEAVKIWAGSK